MKNIFDNLGLSDNLVAAIDCLGFEKPTQIQEQAIPHIMEGKDVIGESATGSGKTLAFGCGIVEQVEQGKGLQALILTPTRELAEQVMESLKEISKQDNLAVISVYGGVAIGPQMRSLREADIVVATPGRLLDHMSRGTIDLSKVKILVLDEADRMLDMGFIDDVEKIIRKCPRERQTLFFSATICGRIRDLSNRYMNKPVKVSAKKMVDPKKLRQVYYNVHKSMRISLLMHLLKKEKQGLVMVFCNTRDNTDFVVKNLKANGVNAIAIHGGLSQNKRTRTLDLFNGAKVGVLVCTDVAARGLHIDNVSHIYNYDLPKDPKDYVHRIGRTARAGEKGKVINLLCEYDHVNFSRILEQYRSFSIRKEEKPYVEKVKNLPVDRKPRNTFKRGPPRRKGRNFGVKKKFNRNARFYKRR